MCRAEALQQERRRLPVFAAKENLLQLVKEHPVVVIVGETGSGKTTQIPQFLHQAGLSRGGAIACTQPRRVAAVTVARRVAEEMGTPLGQLVRAQCVRAHLRLHRGRASSADLTLLARTGQAGRREAQHAPPGTASASWGCAAVRAPAHTGGGGGALPTLRGHWQVGYNVRFDDMTSASTRIKYLTDGMLLREALIDPLLTKYKARARRTHTKRVQTSRHARGRDELLQGFLCMRLAQQPLAAGGRAGGAVRSGVVSRRRACRCPPSLLTGHHH